MTTYRPSARVALTVRLDEGAATADLERRLERQGQRSIDLRAELGGVGTYDAPEADVRAELDRVQLAIEDVQTRRAEIPAPLRAEVLADLEGRRAALQRRLADGPGDPPEAIDGAPPDDRVALGGIVPRSAEITRNGINAADTATIELAYSDAPFDPRMIRAIGIELVIGVVDPVDWTAGIDGARRADGSPTSIVGSGVDVELLGASRFVGVADSWAVSLSGGDGSITIKARDMTAIALDQPLAQGTGIDLSLPIDQGVRALLEDYPALRGTTVVFPDGDPPTPADALPRTRGRRRARRGGASFSVWDHVVETCTQLGLVATFVDYEIRIIRPRTLFARSADAPRLIYGRNLESLEFERKLAGVKVPTVEVRSYDPELGRTRWARWPAPGGRRAGVFGTDDPPPRPARANEVPPSGANPADRIHTFTLSGVTDPDTMAEAARSIYEQIGRQEITGSVTTRDPSAWGEPFAAASLLGLRAGDAVELLVAAADTADVRASLATATVIESLSTQARARYLEGVGWDPEVAQRFAELAEAAQFQTVFRVRESSISWAADTGITIGIEFVNFLEIRELGDGTRDGEPDPPSPEVEELAGERSSVAAVEARRASGLRRLLTRQREEGAISSAEYETRIAEVEAEEARRVAELRRGA